MTKPVRNSPNQCGPGVATKGEAGATSVFLVCYSIFGVLYFLPQTPLNVVVISPPLLTNFLGIL